MAAAKNPLRQEKDLFRRSAVPYRMVKEKVMQFVRADNVLRFA